MTEIDTSAFDRCAGLKSVTCLAPVPPAVGKNTFDSVDCPLSVPSEAVEAYRASGWARWFTRIEAIAQKLDSQDPPHPVSRRKALY